jgi:hypothetical protein
MNLPNYQYIEIPGEDLTLEQFNIPAPPDFIAPDDFPNCCGYHSGVVKQTEEYLNIFPLCCEMHTKWAKKFNRNSTQYQFLKEKIVNQLAYIEHHIEKMIKEEFWYDDITDYIDWHYSSFGNPPVGTSVFLGNLEHNIKQNKNIPANKKKMLLDFIASYSKVKEVKSKEEKSNFGLLVSTYQKWYSTFPFELTFFKNIAEPLKNLPIMKEAPKVNRYSGIAKLKLHTESSLIESLNKFTTNIFKNLDTAKLVKDGIITEFDKVEIELINQKHDVSKKQLFEKYNKNEIKYVNLIKKWLEIEKDYFSNLRNMGKKALPPPKKDKPKKSISFKIKHGKQEKVKQILSKLNAEVCLLKDSTHIDNLYTVLFAKSIENNMPKIELDCFNNQFAYIIDNLKRYFDGLSYSNIGKSGLFISKEGSKLSEANISSSKKNGSFPAKQKEMDAIFKEFL